MSGYTQVPGVDFQDNFVLVVNNMTFWTVFTMTTMGINHTRCRNGLPVQVWKEDIYIYIYVELLAWFFSLGENISQVKGILRNKFEMNQANKKVCLELNHALYRLVQAARLWWLKFVNAMVNVGFECGEVDLC